jgi:predicted DNA-binding protein
MTTATRVTAIRLDDTLCARLDRLAERTGRTKAYYLRELIARGLCEIENLYLAEQDRLDGRRQLRVADAPRAKPAMIIGFNPPKMP